MPNDKAVKPAVPGRVDLYRLVDEELGTVILTAMDMEGFFKEQAEQTSGSVRMSGTSLPAQTGARRLSDVELQVIDFHGEAVGAYYIGEVHILGLEPSRVLVGTDLELSFSGYSLPFPHAGDIWRRWAFRLPQQRDEWRKLPAGWHESWLHVVQNAWFQGGRRATRYALEPRHVIDGSGIANMSSFYCALGEAINGPGGYFGSELNGLADCLGRATAIGAPFRIAWRDFEQSERALGQAGIKPILKVFEDFGVELSLGATGEGTAT